jgi:hypothetical protein
MHDIGGDGEYCGDNDAQLGRINVFYHEASGGKYVPRTVFFEPCMIGTVRASPISFEAALSTAHRLHGAFELGCCAG